MFFLHAEDFFSYTEKKCFPSQKTHARSLVNRIYQQSIILVIRNKMQATQVY